LDGVLQMALQEVSISTTIIGLPVNGSNLDNPREVLNRSFDLTQVGESHGCRELW
jgi:hypothetical protein